MTGPEPDRLATRFEQYWPHLRAVAYRMQGSMSEAEDAVQEAWLRLSRSDPESVGNLGGWLTTMARPGERGRGAVARDAEGQPFSVMSFIVAGGRIVEINIVADPARLAAIVAG